MTTLIIAEKPSVARELAAHVGARSKEKTHYEGGGYLVSWCRGHLVDLATPDEYPQWEGAWDIAKLPMIPDRWVWRASEEGGAAIQYRALERLMRRGDVDCLVNACDADREGEGIFRRAYNLAGCAKPVSRLWSTSLTAEAIEKDMSRMRPMSEYDGLGQAAECRAKADWLVGMNASRAYTCLYGPTLTAGRVQTPVLAMVVERTRAIEGFTSKPYWEVAATAAKGYAELTLTGERTDTEAEAQLALAELLASRELAVDSASYKTERKKAPALYDLTSLQRDASERFGLTAEKTLAAAQSLYEKKLATYPRTDSRYVTEDDRADVEALVEKADWGALLGVGVAAEFGARGHDAGRTVNDKKVSGHTGLLPTRELTAARMAELKGAEKDVMRLICTRLLVAVMDPAVVEKAVIEAHEPTCGRKYRASGTNVVEANWMAVDATCGKRDERERPAKVPAGIETGDALAVRGAEVREGKTTPPKPYTDSTLLSAMENAGRRIEDKELAAAIDDDSSHSGGLGTPATRASIIEGLVQKGYIARRGKSLTATDSGKALVDTVEDSLKKPELTASWEMMLSKVERGEADPEGFMASIEGYTRQVVAEAKEGFDPSRASGMPSKGQRVAEGCSCPRCGAAVLEGRVKLSCSSNTYAKDGDGKWQLTGGCGWEMWLTVAGKRLTSSQAAKVAAGKTVKVAGLKSKSGSKFSAGVRLKGDGASGETELVFEDRRAGKIEGCSCPRCGADVVEGKYKASCSSNTYAKDGDGKWQLTGGCGWEMWLTVAGKRMTQAQAAGVISGATVGMSGLKSRAGKSFSAGVRLKGDGTGGDTELMFD